MIYKVRKSLSIEIESPVNYAVIRCLDFIDDYIFRNKYNNKFTDFFATQWFKLTKEGFENERRKRGFKRRTETSIGEV